MAIDPSMSILVVDDVSTMVRITRNMLQQRGFEDVDGSHGGSTALEMMRAKRYGLVISDWNMEPMTGYDLLQQVRADPELGQIPFIMVTAELHTASVICGEKSGREQSHRQAFLGADNAGQDPGGIRRRRSSMPRPTSQRNIAGSRSFARSALRRRSSHTSDAARFRRRGRVLAATPAVAARLRAGPERGG